MFATLLIFISAMLTGWFYLQKVVGDGTSESGWGREYAVYQSAVDALKPFGLEKDDLFMVNNSAGFSSRPGIRRSSYPAVMPIKQ